MRLFLGVFLVQRPTNHSLRKTNLKRVSLGVTLALVFSLVSPILEIASNASAASVGTGSCVLTVGSNSNVVVTESSGYCYVAFTSGTNSFTVPSGTSSVDVLAIAGGGGGGGGAFAGGGGAGEVVVVNSYSVSSSVATNISVGAGGNGGNSGGGLSTNLGYPADASTDGGNSWVGSSTGVVAAGGGQGASFRTTKTPTGGGSGGSGGGGTEGNSSTNPPRLGGPSVKSNYPATGATRFGYAGADSFATGGNQAGGGGGGAGGAGSTVTTFGIGGSGGTGATDASVSVSVLAIRSLMPTAWRDATTTSGLIAGGGGGGGNSTTGGGTGGGGGGGTGGRNNLAGSPGITNTGSGGGGGTYSGVYIGGSGGSGIIIIRYTSSLPGLTPTFDAATATADGFTFQISNYSANIANYTFAGTATASGTVSISGTGLVTVTGVAPGTSSTATITTARSGYSNGTATATATSITGAALTPTFDTATATSTGFTVQISNYNGSYTWAGTATASGIVSISGTGLITVTGVAPVTSSTATITTTRTGYIGGSATVSATSSSGAALTPTFGTATATSDGYTVTITNYAAAFTFESPTVSAGSVAVTSTSGANRVLTVTGLSPGSSATITQTTTRTNYNNGSATVTGTSTAGSALTPTFGTATATASGFTVQISNYSANSANYTFAGTATASGIVAISVTGLITVTGVAPGTSSTATITTTRTGYSGGSAAVSATSTTGTALTPTFGTPTATAGGFTVTITNYDAAYTWATPTVSTGSVAVTSTTGSNRVLTVTGLTRGSSATITQTNTRTGYTGGSATVSGTSADGAALLSLCVSSINYPLYTADKIAELMGLSTSALTTAISNGSITVWIASGAGIFGASAVGNSQDLFCGDSNNNTVTDLDSDASTKDYFFGGAGNDTVTNSWNSVFYGGPGADSAGSFAEGAIFYGGSGVDTSPSLATGATFFQQDPIFSASSAPTFPTTSISTTSAAQTITITNTGNDSSGSFLYFGAGAIAKTGTNASDFTVVTDTCSSSVIAQLGTCSITVTFTPSGTGTRTANLVFTSDATTSPNTIALSATALGTTRTLTIDASSFVSSYVISTTPPTLTSGVSAGGGTKSYTSSSAGVCTVNSSSGLVAFVTAGTCTISASITADSSDAAATSASVSFTIIGAALTPTFGTSTATASGFTVQISNYSASYTWAGTATASGSVSISGTGLVTVTGVAAETLSTATITTTRTGYTGGSATVSATSTAAVGLGLCALTVNSLVNVVVTQSAGYCYVAFTNGTNSFTVPDGTSSVDVLAIAGGGGGGGGAFAGGGGAGEVVVVNSYSVSSSTATNISVGAGGAGGAANLNYPANTSYKGTNSWVGSSTGAAAAGGGNGASFRTTVGGGSGGSGGGGTENVTTNARLGGSSVKSTYPSTGATRYGNSGGTTRVQTDQAGGGGGGSGSAGGTVPSFGKGGAGGNGTSAVSTWILAIRSLMPTAWQNATTTSGLIAGGGGGGGNTNPGLNGGSGGGGAGGNTTGVAGATNTGSGGGGATYGPISAGGSGGSGLIMIRYFSGVLALTPTFGTPTATSDGFTVQISNYSASYTWAGTATASGTVSISSTGLVTVTGVAAGTSSTATITTTRTGYTGGSATVSASALTVINAIAISGVTAPVRGVTPVSTVTAGTGYTGTVTWASGATPLVGNFLAGTEYTATITLSAATGYTFTGVLANRFTVSGATATNPVNSGVITAVFAAIPAITYSTGTGTVSGTAPTSPTSAVIGGTFTTPFNLYTRAGYSFGGWSDGTNTYAANALYPSTGTVSGNVTLTAQWTGVTYSVLFTYNGRDGGDADASKSFSTGGSAMVLPTPTRTGYTFAGWYSNIGLTTLVGAGGASYSPTLNLTLYAKWTTINYTVTYNSTNVVAGTTVNSTSGTVPTDTTNYAIGQSVSVKANSGTLARTGYTFMGWVTSADGSGTAVNSGQTLTIGSQNISLYPQWSANSYTISYNLNGGSGDLSSAPASWTVGNSNVSLPTTGVTKTGYTFGNGSGGYWSSTQGGSAVANTFGNIGDTTLYAIWTIKTIAYSFDKGTASGLTIANFPSNSSSTFGSTLSLPNLNGTTAVISANTYLFSGWSFNGTTYKSADSYILGETAPTFTALWTRAYDVRYGFAGGIKASSDTEIDDGDAECVTSSLCVPNQTITLRGAPTRTGYQFAGWKVQDSATLLNAGATAVISDSGYLFFAQWTAENYIFTFNSMGGATSHVNQTKNIGQLLTLPDPGAKLGYTFAGWSPDNGTSKITIGSAFVVGSSSQAFVAYWIANVYVVTFDWQGATGTVTPSSNFTVGSGNLTLPGLGNHVKDGFIFAGWAESVNGAAVTNYQPGSDKVLFALWNSGNFSLILDGQGATIVSETVLVARGASYTLPTRSRANFNFIGWFDSLSGGNFIGALNASYLVPSSKTLYARWVQNSLYGVDEATLENAITITASDSVGSDITFVHDPSSTSARVQVQAGALTAGTVISVRYFKETSRQKDLIGANQNYFFSVLVSWMLGSGATATVPNTASSKPILVTLTNASIKVGAMIYNVIGGVFTELQRATENGSITVELRSDPELVVAATPPTAPTSVAATSNGDLSSVISWIAPSSNGGSEITEYIAKVASDSSKSCVTSSLMCTISGLSSGTNYDFVVTASNAVGTSPNSSTTSAATVSVHSVTFDSKEGSFIIETVTFSSGGRFAEPTPPTRSGYNFVGWSATDGGAAVAFPYAPGVASDVTMYAKWSAVSSGSSSGGSPTNETTVGVATPATPNTSVAPVVPATPVRPTVPVLEITGKDAGKVSIADLPILAKPNSPEAKLVTFTVSKTDQKVVDKIELVGDKLNIIPAGNFSGKRTVTLIITENGVEKSVEIPVVVLPKEVTIPVTSPISTTKTLIGWKASPNATKYDVFVNGKKVCSTAGSSCEIRQLLGPNAKVEIVANGGDQTKSENTEAKFGQVKPIRVATLFSYTKTKTILSATDRSVLDRLVVTVKKQGFGTILISQISFTKSTQDAAEKRVQAIEDYIQKGVGNLQITFEITQPTKRTYFNTISVKD